MKLLGIKIPRTIAEQVFYDTLTVSGKFAWKRVGAFVTLHFGFVYAMIPIFKPQFEVHEFVVFSAFGLAAGLMGIDLQQKIKLNEPPPSDNNETIG